LAFLQASKCSEDYSAQITPGREFRSTVETIEEVIEREDAVDEPMPVSETVFDSFCGFVNRIQDGTAYVTLETQSGEKFHGEYSASELDDLGIYEHQRFTLETVGVGRSLEVRFLPVAPVEVPADVADEFAQRVNDLLADGNLDGDQG
jgi:hypothetical protein